MKLMMHILRKNTKLNIDNETILIDEIQSKLFEEFNEVIVATDDYKKNRTIYNLREVVKETFDLVQVCILILYRCHKDAFKVYKKPNLIQQINLEHKDKLISQRSWEPLTGIEIDVKE